MGFSVIPEPAVSGFTGPTGAAGAKGDPGVIQSINGKSAASVTLSASDVNALPSNANATLGAQYLWLDQAAGTYRAFGYKTAGVDRWLFQVDDLAETGSGSGSNFRLSARNDDGSFNKTVIYARRDTGQIAFNTTVLHGTATATSAGAVGIRDISVDPATTTGGVFLYSKAGLPYIKQADGTVFQVGAGGGSAPVSSVNTKTGAVVLGAYDVGALKANDSAYQTNTRAIFQGDGTNNIMEWRNSTGSLVARIGANGNFVGQGASYAVGGLQVGSTSTNFGGGGGAMLGLNDATTIPNANPTAGLVAYSEGGVLKVRQSDGTVVTVANAPTIPVTSVNTKTGAVSLTASDVSAVPSSSVGAASGVAQLDSTTRLPIGQIPAVVAKNEWTPQALGFQAWSVDPSVLATPTVGRSITIGRTYLAGFNITEPTTVSKLFVFAAGWAGSTVVPAARFFAGLYKEDGTSLISSGTTALSNIGAAGQTTGSPTVQQNSHAGAVPFPFTGSVTLQPGRYWGAFLMSAGAATDFYYFYAQNEAATNTSIFHNLSSAFVRNAYVSGMANLTTALTKANFQLNHDQMVMALA
ncbi:minor tail protein [Streptomyces phage Caelum]|uniref:Minor tail protein n=1 Tax=Streptomyces phage Caelum TaxID=2530160 RepID=A0A481W080_9CAUD|nr:tail fiber protein [Streptomyces phage Caelum]QBI99386.1 minor tail protein [Streptomyces phage Caelum]